MDIEKALKMIYEKEKGSLVPIYGLEDEKFYIFTVVTAITSVWGLHTYPYLPSRIPFRYIKGIFHSLTPLYITSAPTVPLHLYSHSNTK